MVHTKPAAKAEANKRKLTELFVRKASRTIEPISFGIRISVAWRSGYSLPAARVG